MKSLNLSRWFLAFAALALFGLTGCSKQAKANRALKKADAFFAVGQYEKAEIEYLNVLRVNRTNLVALRNLGEISYADEMYQRAAVFFNTVKKTAPSDLAARAKLSRLYLAGGSVKEAREEAEFVLQRSATNEDAFLVLAELAVRPEEVNAVRQRVAALRQQVGDKALFQIVDGYLSARNKDLRGAEAAFKTAVNLDPKSATANWSLGNLYLSVTNMALAEPALKAAVDLSPIRSARRVRYAVLKAQAGDLDAANAMLTEMTSKAPDYIPAWVYSARLALDKKNYEKCAADVERVLSRSPDHYEGLSLRAELLVAQGKHQQAIDNLERLTTRYPRSAPARYQLAMAALAAKDTSRAIAALSQAVTLDKNLVPAVLLLAELNIRKGDSRAAIVSLNDLITRQPKLQRAYSLLAVAYQAAGQLNEALAVYDRAVKTFPNNNEAVYMAGIVLRQQGKLAEARKAFEAILQGRPDDPAAHTQLVEIDIAAKNFEPAIQRMQQWSERAPTNAEPLFQMAKVRFAQDDLKASQALLEKVITMNPNALLAYSMLARLYYSTKQVDVALEKCRLALAKNPRDVNALLLSAMILTEKGDYAAARDDYQKLLAITPQNVIALNNLATLYAERLNDIEKAYTLGRQADELRPNDPAIADTFGWILTQRGDYALAATLLKAAAQGKPTDAEVISHLGMTQYMLGDETAARATLDQAFKLSATFNGHEQARGYLAVLNINPAGTDQNAVATLEKRLTERPADPVALSRLAAIYDRSNQSDKVIALYEKALAANPKLAIATARLAQINDERLKNPAKALELAKEARKLDSESPEIAHIAGRIAAKSSDVKDQQWGLNLLQESSQKRTGDPNLTYDLAWAYYAQGRVGDAETSMNAAIAAGPNLPFAASAKRFLEFLPLADPAQAAQQQAKIDQALQADANYLPALAARAAAAQQKGDNATALKTLDQALARYPGFAPAIRSSAILMAGQPGVDAQKALQMATRALQLYSEDVEVAKALGISQYQRADYPSSARTLRDVARKRPNDAAVQYYLGLSHYQLKEKQQSKAALTNAVKLDPKATFVADAQRVLKELN